MNLSLDDLEDFLDHIVLGNSIKEWLLFSVVAVCAYLVLSLVVRFIVGRARRGLTTKPDLDATLAEMASGTMRLFLLVVALHLGADLLDLSATASKWEHRTFVLFTALQIMLWGKNGIRFGLRLYLKSIGADDVQRSMSLSLLTFITQAVFFALVLLVGLNNVGVNITALVTGLGVGGIAVALAVQNILSDLFASLTIVLDKPFVVGDFIAVDDLLGTIEKVGLKTTRIRSLTGEQLIFPNASLLQSRIRNYKRMEERRVVFSFGLTYDTPPDVLRRIPGAVKALIEAQSLARFDRVHFSKFSGSSLDFEVVYWVLSPDFNVHMDVQQEILLGIAAAVESMKASFAYPTQTVFVHQADPVA